MKVHTFYVNFQNSQVIGNQQVSQKDDRRFYMEQMNSCPQDFSRAPAI